MTLDAQVLRCFLRARGQFVSGTAIGDLLGLSRVSVHNHLAGLKREGFVFSAIRNRGYRLEREPDAFHAALFEALIAEQPIPFFSDRLAIGETDSTNNVAELELSRGRPTPFFVVADCQTAGRGRRGRAWHSPRGKNLYISVAIRPVMAPARLQTITLWLGLRLCRFLRDAYALPVLVKWPNDLMLHGRKLAGMLTEARVDSEQTRDLVFGLGLNVNAGPDDFPADLAGIATSLAQHLGKPVCLSRLAHALLQHLAGDIRDYLENAYAEELAAAWPELDFLRGRQVQAGEVSGRVLGISANGSLRLEKPDGSTVLLHSGEVTIGSAQAGREK